MKYYFVDSHGIVKNLTFVEFFKLLQKSVIDNVNFYSESYEDDLLMEYINAFKKLLKDGMLRINKNQDLLIIKGD